MRWVIGLIMLGLCWSHVVVHASNPGPGPSEGLRTLSLKVLQERARDCGDRCGEEIEQLVGLREITGYVVDKANRDLILIGPDTGTGPPLNLEDLVIGLRNVWNKYVIEKGGTLYYQNPGCSIDPDAAVMQKLTRIAGRINQTGDEQAVDRALTDWRETCRRPQKVRVLGVPFNTRFARVMVEADYDMKSLVDGSKTLDGLTSLTEMTLAQVRQAVAEGNPTAVSIGALNRFWFTAGEAGYRWDDGIVMLDHTPVVLLTEEEYVAGGSLHGRGRPEALAGRFAQDFSARYQAIGAQQPIFAELSNLFQLVTLAKVLEQREPLSDMPRFLEFLLDGYRVRRTAVAPSLPGRDHVVAEKQTSGNITYSFWMPSCGGVTIAHEEIEARRQSGSQLRLLRERVLAARPDQTSLSWTL